MTDLVRKTSAISSEACPSCGYSGLRQRYVTRSCGTGDSVVVIEHIPMLLCPHCGEGHFTPHTLRAIDRMQAERDAFPSIRQAPVLVFPA